MTRRGGPDPETPRAGDAQQAGTSWSSWTTTQRLTIVAAGLGVLMVLLDALVANVALPDIQADFGVGEAGLQWVVTAYSLGMAVMMMPSASLADRLGRRRLYVIGLVGFALGSLGAGLAPDLGTASVARCLQGLAAAMVTVASLALVSAAFPDPKSRVRALGIWTAVGAGGLAMGPTVGGVLTDSLGWRSVFLINIPVAAAAIVLAIRFVEESADSVERRTDLLGQALFAVAMGGFSYAVIEGQSQGWSSPIIIGTFALTAGSFAAFVRHELRRDQPMMDLRLFENRDYAVAIVSIFAAFFSVYGVMLIVTQYIQNVQGASALETGLLLLPFALAQLLLSPRAGRIAARVGHRLPVIGGQIATLSGLVVLIAGLGHGDALIVLGTALVGLGMSLTITPVTGLAMSAVPADRAGMASGILSTQRAVGSTAGYAVLGSVLAIWLGASLDTDLAQAIPDPTERAAVTQQIIDEANPHAYAAEVGPGRPITSADPDQEAAILEGADESFTEGMRLALATAVLLDLGVLAAQLLALRRADPD